MCFDLLMKTNRRNFSLGTIPVDDQLLTFGSGEQRDGSDVLTGVRANSVQQRQVVLLDASDCVRLIQIHVVVEVRRQLSLSRKYLDRQIESRIFNFWLQAELFSGRQGRDLAAENSAV